MDDSEPDFIAPIAVTVQAGQKKPAQEKAHGMAHNEDTTDHGLFKFFSKKKKQDSRKSTERATGKADVASVHISRGDLYDMSNERRGIAFIFSNKNFETRPKREGVEHDERSLRQCLTRLGFEIRLFQDQYTDQMEDILRDASHDDHTGADCFVCVIMSHGDENGIYGKGPKPLAIKQLTRYFKGDKCPTLAGKPKLFFVQACRGDSVDAGVSVDVTDGAILGFKKKKKVPCRIPTSADFLMAYSTCEDYLSFKNKKTGSWFIQSLVSELKNCDGHVEICTVLQRVTRRVAFDHQSDSNHEDLNKKKQCPCYSSTLTKQLFLIPK